MGLYSGIDNVTFGFLRGVRSFFSIVKDALKAFISIIGATIARTIAYSLVFLIPCLVVAYFVSEDSLETVALVVTAINVLVALFRSIVSRKTDPDMSDIVSEIAEAVGEESG